MKTLREYLKGENWQSCSQNPLSSKESQLPFFKVQNSSVQAMLCAQYALQFTGVTLVILESQSKVETLAFDLKELLGEDCVATVPDCGLSPYEFSSLSLTFLEERAEFFEDLAKGLVKVLISTPERLTERFAPPFNWLAEQREFCTGEEYDLDELCKWLYTKGYREDSLVENAGFYSLRGGILDVYPLNSPNPVRFDFFGDELEQIRYFDVFSQRSVETVERIVLKPFGEMQFEEADWMRAQKALEALYPENRAEINALMDQNRRFHRTEGLWWQRVFFCEQTCNLLELLPSVQVLASESSLLENRFREVVLNYKNARADLPKGSAFVAEEKSLLGDWEELDSFLQRSKRGFFCSNAWSAAKFIQMEIQTPARGSMNLDDLAHRVEELAQKGVRSYVLAANAGQVNRLKTVLQDMEIAGVLEGDLNSGFVFEKEGIAFFTDHQLFNRLSKKRQHKKHRGYAVALTDFRSLEKGDFVLHRDYGVGSFVGLTRIQTGVGATDCILLKFAGKDSLSLPIDDLSKLEKYVGKEGTSPQLDRLGGKKWETLKAKVKKKVVQIAKELVELYAKRELQKGFSFPPDDEAQREFEEDFPYAPTKDQIQAVRECKFDMENGRPMDRLVCGDVGFGKTEVAMRCAFKAVNAGKQVAVLVPTTILAQQHFENFVERFSAWPIRVEVVSRYKSAKQKKELFAKVKMGAVDILVGTHALLGSGLTFKDLGLFIIDEEQKFGVKQKERLREIRLNVDTLAMSATPIPRTLHLSLSGVRDISTISTPPRNRLPVETRVVEFDKKLIAKAIKEEMERGGQVFVVNDFVRGLDELAEVIHAEAPEARLAIAHGQLPEKELERVMSAFTHREYDVLLCTNIVESGIDISSVNTILIHNAHNFGMSQLYQLRGRVGRSELKAHAYLVVPKNKKLSEDAKKRLQSMEMYTDLGSGFKLAMRDLEIRGAGNLLGTEQSGFIAEIGYETYIRMVKEAVQELRGERVEHKVESKLELNCDAFLPEAYIEDGLQRLNMYQRLSRVEHPADVDQLAEELQDRFGAMDQSVQDLLRTVHLRLFANHFGFGQVAQMGNSRLKLTFSPHVVLGKPLLEFLIRESKLPLQFSYNTPVEVIVDYKGKGFAEAVENGRFLLEKHLSLQA